MTPKTEMDYFFARNCFTEAERKRVKTWPAYQVAMDKDDIVEAQEIAMQVLERGLGMGVSPDFSAPRLPPGEI